jgi:hypothetical protein
MSLVTATFKIRFDRSQIGHWALRYSYPGESVIEIQVAPRVRSQGYFTLDDFLALCRWKSTRPEQHYVENKETDVRAVTTLALATEDERLRIRVLTALQGVNWPMASVMLHFAGRDRYPILDFRALWSLGVDVPKAYGFKFWWEYTVFCRHLV